MPSIIIMCTNWLCPSSFFFEAKFFLHFSQAMKLSIMFLLAFFLILHLALPRCESCVPLLMFRMQSLDLQCIMCQQAGFKHLSWRKVDFIALSQSLFTVQNIYLDIVLACCLNPCVVIIQLLFSEKFQTAFETPTFFMHHKIWIWKKCFLFSDMIKKNTGE